MKSTFVALSPELLLCLATGKDKFADITGEDFVRLLSGPRIGPDKPQAVMATILITAKLTEGLFSSGGIEKVLEIAPGEAHFLRRETLLVASTWGGIEERLRAACSDATQRKKRLRK